MVYGYDITADKFDWLSSVEEVTGYTPEELKGAGVDFWKEQVWTSGRSRCGLLEGAGVDFWKEHVHPEDRDKLWKNYENHMKNEGNFRLEYRFRTKNDYYIYLEENGIRFIIRFNVENKLSLLLFLHRQ